MQKEKITMELDKREAALIEFLRANKILPRNLVAGEMYFLSSVVAASEEKNELDDVYADAVRKLRVCREFLSRN